MIRLLVFEKTDLLPIKECHKDFMLFCIGTACFAKLKFKDF